MRAVEEFGQRIAAAVTATALAPNRSFKRGFARAVILARKTVRFWQGCDATRLAAALAFYTMFSLAPMFVIFVAIAGLALGNSVAADTFGPLSEVLGPVPTRALQTIVMTAHTRGADVTALVTGIVTALVGAGALFGQLHDALNVIFGQPEEPRRTALAFVRRNAVAIALVVFSGLVFTVSIVIEAGTAVLESHNAMLVRWTNLAITYTAAAVLFTFVYKYLPAHRLRWAEALVGAAATSALLVSGQAFIGWYLGRAAIGFGYGVAGSLMLVLLWVYYSGLTLLAGAAFTRAYMETARQGIA